MFYIWNYKNNGEGNTLGQGDDSLSLSVKSGKNNFIGNFPLYNLG